MRLDSHGECSTIGGEVVMETTWIYALIDPRTNAIRYAGKATNPNTRLCHHIGRARRKQPAVRNHKDNWLLLLEHNGIKPLIRCLEEVDVAVWRQKERDWIATLREQGEPLLNILPGGEGGATYGRLGKPWTKEHRANYLAARTGMSINQRDPKGLRAESLKKVRADYRASGKCLKEHSVKTKKQMSESALSRMKRLPHTNPRNLWKLQKATLYEWRGGKLSLREWAIKLNVPKSTLVTRLYRGWTLDRTLSTPSRKQGNR